MLTLHLLVSVDYISHPSPINPAWSESPTVNSREYYQMFIEYVHTRVVNTTDTDTGVVRVREIQMSDDNQNWQKKKKKTILEVPAMPIFSSFESANEME